MNSSPPPAPDNPSKAARISPRRLNLFRFIATAGSVIVALFFLELGLRLYLLRFAESVDRFRVEYARNWGDDMSLVHFIRPARDLNRVYEMIPGANGVFVGAPLRINAAGFRDIDRDEAKPDDVKRIAVLGDSVAFGWGVPREEGFSEKLQALTSNTTAGVEVWNFAVPGYNSTMELATLEGAVLKTDPDVVVVSIVANDDELPNFIRLKPQVWSLRQSFIMETIRDRLMGRPFGDTARLAAGGVVEAGGVGHGQNVRGYRPELVPPEYHHLMGMDNARRALATMVQVCRAKNIPVVALVFSPNLGGANAANDAPPADLVPWIEAAKDAGATLCDPTPALRRYLRQHSLTTAALWVSSDDIHPNAAAHEIIAKELSRVIEGLKSE
jgi:lysophospholipase L1-like esterase